MRLYNREAVFPAYITRPPANWADSRGRNVNSRDDSLYPTAQLRMFHTFSALAGLLAGGIVVARPAAAQQTSTEVRSPSSLAELKTVNEQVKALVAKVRPAVVQVAGGSGVVVAPTGW